MNLVGLEGRATSELMRRRRLLYPVGAALGLALLSVLTVFIFSNWPVHAQTTTVPAIVYSIDAEPRDGRVKLTWIDSLNDGGAEITGYAVTYSSNSVDFTAWPHTGTEKTTTITGLTNGLKYIFAVAAINSVGTGPEQSAVGTPFGLIKSFEFGYGSEDYTEKNWSFDTGDFISFVIHTSYLAAPYERDATSPFNVSFEERAANFKIQFNLGGETREAVFRSNPAPYQNQRFFFRYKVTEDDLDLDGITVDPNSLSIADGFSFIDFDLIDVTDLSHPRLDLDGVNESLVLVNAPRPAPPRNIEVTEVGDDYFVVEWDVPDPTLEPINDAGGYTYRLWSTRATPVVYVKVPGGSSTTEVRIDQLPNGDPLVKGVEYSFVLYSANRWRGLFRFISRENPLEPHVVFKISSLFNRMMVTPATTPSEPLSVTAIGGTEEITLTWTASGDDGGAPISQYEYQKIRILDKLDEQFLDDTEWISTDYSDGDPLSHVITGLEDCRTYQFRMQAVNSIGNSPVSDEATAATDCPVPLTTPSTPLSVNAMIGRKSITLAWTASADDGGSPMLQYEYQIRSPDEQYDTKWISTDDSDGNPLSHVITRFKDCIPYVLRMRAVNSRHNSPVSTEVNTRTICPPGEVRDFAVTGGYMAIKVTWSAPIQDIDVSGYVVEYLEVQLYAC